MTRRTTATHLGFAELDDGLLLVVELGLEGRELLAAFLNLDLRLLDRLANGLGLLLVGLELLLELGDLLLELLDLGRARLDRLGRLGEVLLGPSALRLGLDEARLVVADLVLQVGDLGLLAAQLEAADLLDLALEGGDLVLVLGRLGAQRLELALERRDGLLKLSDALDVAGVGLALRPERRSATRASVWARHEAWSAEKDRGRGEEDAPKLGEQLGLLDGVLLVGLDVHLELGDLRLDTSELLLERAQVGLGLLEELGELLQLDRRRLLLRLELSELLRRDIVGGEAARHLATQRARAADLRGARLLGDVAVECDDAPPLAVHLAGRDGLRNVPRLGDERVLEYVLEDGRVRGVLGRDEVEQALRALGRLDRRQVDAAEAVEGDARRAADVVLAQVVEDGLGRLARVDDERLEPAGAGRRDGDVELVVDATEVTEAPLCA